MKDNQNRNERIKTPNARHLYDVGTDKGIVEVEAYNRVQACRKAELAGYVVRDVNMVG